MEKLVLLVGLLLLVLIFFGCLGENPNAVTVYSENMEPTLFSGQVVPIRNAIETDNFGTEVFLDLNIKSTPVYEFVEPIYSNHKLYSMLFNEVEVFPEKGKIVVYRCFPSDIKIMNRSIVKLVALDGNFVLTKGDNEMTNPTFDQDCGQIINNKTEKVCLTYYAIPIDDLKVVDLEGI